MSNNQNSNTSLEPTSNPASVYFLHPSDCGLKLVSDVFNGSGYSDWKRAMMIALSGKNKLCFVDGSLKRPGPNSPNVKAWDRVNSIVMGWLLNTLEHSIAKSVLWFKTAWEIWFELEERYGQPSSAQLFALQEEISNTVQTHDVSMAEFFTKMKSLWDELDNLDPLPTCSCTGCSCNLTQKFYKMQQGHRLIHFLMKLDIKYSHVRSNLLMMSELPTLAQAYRILMQEQKHQELNKLTNETNDSLAFRVEKRRYHTTAFQKSTPMPSQHGPTVEGPKPYMKNLDNVPKAGHKRSNPPFCDHCKMHGHTVDRCYKIHGYPNHFKNVWRRNTGTAHIATTTDVPGTSTDTVHTTLTSAQYKQLMHILQHHETTMPEHLKPDDAPNTDTTTALLAGPFDERALASW